MISIATGLIRDELRNFIINNKRGDDPITAAEIVLDNIAGMEQAGDKDLNDKVVISVVNVEEESALKNRSNHFRNPITNGLEYVDPPVSLNLYILFCATLSPASGTAYEFALHRISLIVSFFQSKRVFTVQNSPHSSIGTDPLLDNRSKDSIRLSLELYTLTFEQINHLWGSLGGKQVPFVMYKARLVEIVSPEGLEAPLIQEVNGELETKLS